MNKDYEILLSQGEHIRKFNNKIQSCDDFELIEECETAISHMIKNTYNNPNYRIRTMLCYIECFKRNKLEIFEKSYKSCN